MKLVTPSDVKTVTLVVIGLIVGGIIIGTGRKLPILKQAHSGFDSVGLS